MEDRYGIIWNPVKTTHDVLLTLFPEELHQHLTFYETSEHDAGQLAAEKAVANGATVIIAAGGDGTVRAVAEFLADTKADVEFAILPFGTGNIFARNLRIPLSNPKAAGERAITDGSAESYDVGWVEAGGTRFAFIVMAGFGIDAQMIIQTDEELKSRAGWLAYVDSLRRVITTSQVQKVTLKTDKKKARHERAHTVMVGNCGAFQTGFILFPDANPQDGRLDLLSLNADGLTGWMDTFWNMIWHNGVVRLLKRVFRKRSRSRSSRSIRHQQFQSLELTCESPQMFEVDGDDIGEYLQVLITIQRGAIRVR